MIKILIVEDEAMTALYMKTILEKKNYAATTVSSGEKAVELYALERHDLVLMDIHLAGEMNGIEASLAIIEIAPVPVIFTTGYQEQSYLKKAGDIRPLAYVTKPLDMNMIEKIIADYFAGRGRS